MSQTVAGNELYFAVLPQIVVSGGDFGKTQQVLTLLPDKTFATEFFPDEVDTYVQVFQNRIINLSGGHVTGYFIEKQTVASGRVIVRVTQHVKP
jgi:hypothetical protein